MQLGMQISYHRGREVSQRASERARARAHTNAVAHLRTHRASASEDDDAGTGRPVQTPGTRDRVAWPVMTGGCGIRPQNLLIHPLSWPVMTRHRGIRPQKSAPSPGILTGHDRRARNPASESDSHFVVDYLVARVKTKRDIVGHLHWTELLCIIHEKAAFNTQSSSFMLHSIDDLRINHPPGAAGRKGAFRERANLMLSLKLTASYQGYKMGWDYNT